MKKDKIKFYNLPWYLQVMVGLFFGQMAILAVSVMLVILTAIGII